MIYFNILMASTCISTCLWLSIPTRQVILHTDICNSTHVLFKIFLIIKWRQFLFVITLLNLIPELSKLVNQCRKIGGPYLFKHIFKVYWSRKDTSGKQKSQLLHAIVQLTLYFVLHLDEYKNTMHKKLHNKKMLWLFLYMKWWKCFNLKAEERFSNTLSLIENVIFQTNI